MMSDPTNRPTETVTDADSNGLKPLSNSDDYDISLPTTGSDLDRLTNRTGFAIANGLPIDDDDSDEEEEEEVGGDYVAVDHDDTNDISYWFRRPPVHQRTKLDELHPFVQVLNMSNVDDCVNVENAFPEHERCSRDKFLYRLNRCPELTLGLFTLPVLEEGKPKPRATLVGHIIATRTSSPLVTDASMQLPKNWKTDRFATENGETIGHDEYGTTIAIHSLAVLPEHQGKQVGTTLMKAYIQRIKEAEIAERISIIAHDHLLAFYQSLGFQNRGPSKCQFGGGGWIDLVLELGNEEE